MLVAGPASEEFVDPPAPEFDFEGLRAERARIGSVRDEKPLVSVIVTGRDDNRAPNQLERLIALQRTLAYSLREVPFELLFVEWNPDPGSPLLGRVLYLDEARHFVVTRQAHEQLIADAAMTTRSGVRVKSERAFLLNHANNVGMKHARGEWILIINVDNVVSNELGEFLATGFTRARAVGWYPRWTYWLMCRHREARRKLWWHHCARLVHALVWPLMFAARLPSRVLSILADVVDVFARWISGNDLSRSRGGGRLLRLARRLLPYLARMHRRVRRVFWLFTPPILLPIGRGVEAILLTLLRLGAFAAGGFAIWLRRTIGNPGSLLRPPLRALFRSLRPVGRLLLRIRGAFRMAANVLRRCARFTVKSVRDFFMGPRVRWHNVTIPLQRGTMYRVRRESLNESLAIQGVSAPRVEDYVRHVREICRPGPWNDNYPWTWACGDFMLLDYATWSRIGGFPQQIGQLHADSVTVMRIIAEGCRIALLDWNIYHFDHEDRFDSVPYVEYDLEHVHQYFMPGWSKAEATLVKRPNE